MLALIGIGTVIVIGLAVVGAVVGTYFFLRNNPRKRQVIDRTVDEVGRRYL